MRTIVLSVVFASLSGVADARGGTSFLSGGGTTSATFAKIPLGARPAGMGDAFTAIADDLNSIDWNPAGLSSVSDVQIEFMHCTWMLGVGHEYFAYAQPSGGTSGFGISASWLHTSGVARMGYDVLANNSDGTGFSEVGEVAGSGFGITFAYGNRLDNLIKFKQPIDITIGLAMKILAERLDAETDYGVGGDLGFLWLVRDDVTFGIVLQNLGAGSSGYLLPMTAKIGGGYHLKGLAMPKDKLTVGLEAVGFIETPPQMHLGLEYRWGLGKAGLMVRGGYRFVQDLGAIAGLTAGVGADLVLGSLHVQIDYAHVRYGELGSTHRVGVTLKV